MLKLLLKNNHKSKDSKINMIGYLYTEVFICESSNSAYVG